MPGGRAAARGAGPIDHNGGPAPSRRAASCPDPPVRTVTATRYVSPLREGGSLPAIVEGDDDGLYVLKFRGAGQGPKVLVAELLAGEMARACGLAVPEIVFMQLDADLARTEPDPEIQDLLRASDGLNLALDYLPGSVTFDPLAGGAMPAALASQVVWFDALVSNMDRTARNTNLLMWHRRLWLIDHGAALIFHHQWDGYLERSTSPFASIKDHVLLAGASQLPAADAELSARLTPESIAAIVDLVPDDWLEPDPLFDSPQAQREAYVRYFASRLQPPRRFVEEAVRARSLHL
jgi:hypothetical protein